MIPTAKGRIKSTLVKILDEHYLGAKSNQIISMNFEELLNDLNIDPIQIGQIFDHLREQNIIKKYTIPFPDIPELGITGGTTSYITVPKNFRLASVGYISELSEDSDISKFLLLYLDDEGNLWHGNKEEYCYPIGATSNRLAIIKCLISNKSFQQTSVISSALNSKDEQNIRTEIGKIKEKIKTYLKIDDLIESKKDSGYRINPKYQIAFR